MILAKALLVVWTVKTPFTRTWTKAWRTGIWKNTSGNYLTSLIMNTILCYGSWHKAYPRSCYHFSLLTSYSSLNISKVSLVLTDTSSHYPLVDSFISCQFLSRHERVFVMLVSVRNNELSVQGTAIKWWKFERQTVQVEDWTKVSDRIRDQHFEVSACDLKNKKKRLLKTFCHTK